MSIKSSLIIYQTRCSDPQLTWWHTFVYAVVYKPFIYTVKALIIVFTVYLLCLQQFGPLTQMGRGSILEFLCRGYSAESHKS